MFSINRFLCFVKFFDVLYLYSRKKYENVSQKSNFFQIMPDILQEMLPQKRVYPHKQHVLPFHRR